MPAGTITLVLYVRSAVLVKQVKNVAMHLDIRLNRHSPTHPYLEGLTRRS